MSQTPPTNARTLRQASARLRRILAVAAVVLVVGEALWCLIGGSRGSVARPLWTLLAAAGSTTVLLAATWWFLDRMVDAPFATNPHRRRPSKAAPPQSHCPNTARSD